MFQVFEEEGLEDLGQKSGAAPDLGRFKQGVSKQGATFALRL